MATAREVSPVGDVLYAHIQETEKFKSEDGSIKDLSRYSVMLHFDLASERALLEKIHKAWDAYKPTLPINTQFARNDYNLPVKKLPDKNGVEKLYFVFRQNASFVSRDTNETINMTIKVFDSNKKNITKNNVILTNGSLARVSYTIVPYYANPGSYGVTLRFPAIQIVRLRPINDSAESYGFDDVKDGYVFANPEENIEVPF